MILLRLHSMQKAYIHTGLDSMRGVWPFLVQVSLRGFVLNG